MTQLSFLKISGENAKKFLQGQLTCNLEEVSEQPLLGAHCNPQGRIISLFRIFLRNNEYYLQMPSSMIPIALPALKKYAVFFKVNLTEEPAPSQDNQDDIAQGIASIYPETSEKFLPHEINLPALGGVSFNKGCYTGQEIIARMQYRGKLKTRVYRVKACLNEDPLRGGDVFSESERCGSIIDYCNLGYNNYELLIITPENKTSLALDSENKMTLEIIG